MTLLQYTHQVKYIGSLFNDFPAYHQFGEVIFIGLKRNTHVLFLYDYLYALLFVTILLPWPVLVYIYNINFSHFLIISQSQHIYLVYYLSKILFQIKH